MLKLTVNTVKNDGVETRICEGPLKSGVREVKFPDGEKFFIAITEDLKFVAAGLTANDAVGNLQNPSAIEGESATVEIKSEPVPVNVTTLAV
jgi:hypothetical protein